MSEHKEISDEKLGQLAQLIATMVIQASMRGRSQMGDGERERHVQVPIDVEHMRLKIGLMGIPVDGPNLDPTQEVAVTIVLLRCSHCGTIGQQPLIGTWSLDQVLGNSVRGAIDELTAAPQKGAGR